MGLRTVTILSVMVRKVKWCTGNNETAARINRPQIPVDTVLMPLQASFYQEDRALGALEDIPGHAADEKFRNCRSAEGGDDDQIDAETIRLGEYRMVMYTPHYLSMDLYLTHLRKPGKLLLHIFRFRGCHMISDPLRHRSGYHVVAGGIIDIFWSNVEDIDLGVILLCDAESLS